MNSIDTVRTAAIRAAVVAHGFPRTYADLVEVSEGGMPGTVTTTWSYPTIRKGKPRRAEVAVINSPADVFEQQLEADRLADTIIALRPTLPSALRALDIPTWATERGNRVRDMLAAARGASHRAAAQTLPLAA